MYKNYYFYHYFSKIKKKKHFKAKKKTQKSTKKSSWSKKSTKKCFLKALCTSTDVDHPTPTQFKVQNRRRKIPSETKFWDFSQDHDPTRLGEPAECFFSKTERKHRNLQNFLQMQKHHFEGARRPPAPKEYYRMFLPHFIFSLSLMMENKFVKTSKYSALDSLQEKSKNFPVAIVRGLLVD